jgi:hypothetical protein
VVQDAQRQVQGACQVQDAQRQVQGACQVQDAQRQVQGVQRHAQENYRGRIDVEQDVPLVQRRASYRHALQNAAIVLANPAMSLFNNAR